MASNPSFSKRYLLVSCSQYDLHRISWYVTELAQSVERVDCRAGGRGLDSWGRTNTQCLKITEK